MDSGNSGSVQSSSGGDEEYDSRPAFLNSHHFGSLSSNPQHNLSLLPHHHHHHHQQQTTLFDRSPSLFHDFSQSPQNPNLNSSLLNLDGSSSVAASSSPSILGSCQAPIQSRSFQDNNARNSSQSDQNQLAPRNPKKRTRASRRAPTTVLATDTSNFRAMVQQFTGIPAPPFSGSPYSRRLDLFGSMRSGSHLEPAASLYPLRPSAQKVNQQSPFLFSSSSSSSSLNNTVLDANNTNIACTTTTTSAFNSSSINYQPQNQLNMQNQMLSFQSLLSPPQLQTSLNAAGLSAKSQFEELGMGHAHGQVNANLDGVNVVGSHENQDQVRSLDSCKLNYSASSSDFHHEKGLENVPPRGEGTVESWMCPSE